MDSPEKQNVDKMYEKCRKMYEKCRKMPKKCPNCPEGPLLGLWALIEFVKTWTGPKLWGGADAPPNLGGGMSEILVFYSVF